MLLSIDNFINYLIEIIKTIGPIAGLLVVVIESIIPILPLAAFITLNMIVFGSFTGFVISWIGTLIGCVISFYIFRKGFSHKLYKKIKRDSRFSIIMNNISAMKITYLALLVALPFTPAFFVNIAAGLSKMPLKKFMIAITIGKVSMIYFWGYIGISLIESIKNPLILLEIIVIMLLVYYISKLIQNKLYK